MKMLMTQVAASNDLLGVSLHCHDTVDYRENIYIKKVLLKNLADSRKGIPLFFHHDFISSNLRRGIRPITILMRRRLFIIRKTAIS